ncbi:Cellulose synthase-like protein E1 [Raphanus sativus]|nr:Cellulose synthase-like protein E1 [Raphanus sativus]
MTWNPVWRFTFADRLSRRYGDDLPKLDAFVCTADPVIEPPLMVVNTVLSVMALDYPPEKLAVYLSDDGGSQLTFYALAEAAEFAKTWVPFWLSQWDSEATQRNHGAILQILVDGRRKEKTVAPLPTLVYLSREKRPEHHHHFKAGSMNALSALEALCILLDEKEGKEIAFVQFPQCFENLTKNDLYDASNCACGV